MILTRVVERRRIEAGERVVGPTWKDPGPARLARGVLAGDAEGGERLGGGLDRPVRFTARKEPTIALDMQPVPVTDDISS